MQFRLKISKLIFIKFNNIPIACIPNIIRYVVSFFLIIFNSKMYTKSTKAITVNTIFPIIATIPFFVAYLPNSVLYFSILFCIIFSASSLPSISSTTVSLCSNCLYTSKKCFISLDICGGISVISL